MRTRRSDVLLMLALLAGLYLWQRTALPAYMADYFPNKLAAHFWKTGKCEWLYAPAERYNEWMAHCLPLAREMGLSGDLCTFMYPPFVAAVLSPVADIPAEVWHQSIFVINVILLFVLALLIVRLWDVKLNARSYLWALAIVLLCYPMARAAKLGQIVPLIAALTWIALLWIRQGREYSGGILLGLMSAIKLFPVALVLLPILDRRYRSVFVAVGIVFIVFGISIALWGIPVHAEWWQVMREFSERVIPYWGNQSLLGWLARAAFGRGMLEGVPVLLPGLWFLRVSLILIFGGATLYLLWHIRGTVLANQLAMGAGLLMSGVLLAVPNSWEHYWLFVLPSLAWGMRENVVSQDRKFWQIWFWVAAFLFMAKLTRLFHAETAFSRVASGSQMFGLLMFWVWLARLAAQKAQRKSVDDVAVVPARG